MFFTSGIVLMTLVINAPTTGILIRWLGLAQEHDMSIRILQKVLEQHDAKTKEFINQWTKDRKEHGDKGGNLYDNHLDLEKLKKDKKQIIQDLRLKKIYNMYKNGPANTLKMNSSTISNQTNEDQ